MEPPPRNARLVREEFLALGLAIVNQLTHIRFNTRFVSTLTTDVLAGSVEAMREGRCEFRPAFFLFWGAARQIGCR